MLRLILLTFCTCVLAACTIKTATPSNPTFTPSPQTSASPTLRLTPTRTPTPRTTATPKITAMPRGSVTPGSSITPRSSATPPPVRFVWGLTPTGEAEDYTLRPWAADSALRFANTTPPAFPTDSQGQAYQEEYAWPPAKLAVLREIVARFPTFTQAAEAQQALLDPQTYGWATEIPVEPFRAAFETALNLSPTVEISDTALTDLLQTQFPQAAFFAVQVLPADNVLGEDAPSWALDVRAASDYGNYGAAFAVVGQPGAYRVATTQTLWQRFAWSDQRVLTTDLNANGIPEIAVWESRWGTGMSHFCVEHLAVYEWNGDQFVDLTPGLATQANTDAGDCLGFEFVGGPNNPQAITTGNSIDSFCFESEGTRGELRLQRRYEWNGAYFALARNEILPRPEGADITKCTLSWVNEAGPTNAEAFELLPRLLATTDLTLTADFADQFGPAYLDFFHFKLGAWYAMHGQQAQALALLTQVRDAPANPEFNTASKMAEAFLNYYPTVGVYAGCAAASKQLNLEAFRSEFLVEGFSYSTGAMREAWGFSDPQWGFGYGSFWSGTTLRADPLNVCSLIPAFQLAVEQQAFSTTQDLTAWLAQQQIAYTGLEEGDVNGDGRRDWLLLVSTGSDQTQHVWVLLNQGGGLRAHWVTNTYRDTGNIPAVWNRFTPYAGGAALNVYQWPEGLVIFRAVAQTGEAGLEVVHSVNRFQYETFAGFTLQSAPTTTQQTLDATHLRIAGKEDNDWYTLGWDPALNTLRVVASPAYNQGQALQKIEDLLFVQQNPVAASASISELLSTTSTPYGDLPTVEPYLWYLQGLAYEMQGETPKAIEAYWTLWHEFPIHPLSYVVQQKLEPRKR